MANALDAIGAAGGATRVLVHDAARPFLPHAVIDRLLGALESAQAAIPVLPVFDSLVDASAGPVDRASLQRVQTRRP
ncbi:MAG: bifunctional 2-C-methyl-D-erythritol 4-phosphate cytidylyltransferase/2-C-methyl-D-erythritol 2,4-cyclodiphosphate synthase, partial [Akkermansiaceae bacterium]|nr:bifunctional 2-C-methyl-D-erythritol 4-phosphate cytidylyltransferase/2-C-methyl-D-erythritol 2,4-cyclodiphosphate synthase [Akkermansiaceae bacterium]